MKDTKEDEDIALLNKTTQNVDRTIKKKCNRWEIDIGKWKVLAFKQQW